MANVSRFDIALEETITSSGNFMILEDTGTFLHSSTLWIEKEMI